MVSDVARIAALRRKAERLGLTISKSRARNWSINNQLGWRVVETNRNVCLDGPDYDMALDDVAAFLDRYEGDCREGRTAR